MNNQEEQHPRPKLTALDPTDMDRKAAQLRLLPFKFLLNNVGGLSFGESIKGLLHELAAQLEQRERELLEAEQRVISAIIRADNTQNQFDHLAAQYAAAVRLVKNSYKPWSLAGGPEECRHKVSKEISCERCDIELIRDALNPPMTR